MASAARRVPPPPPPPPPLLLLLLLLLAAQLPAPAGSVRSASARVRREPPSDASSRSSAEAGDGGARNGDDIVGRPSQGSSLLKPSQVPCYLPRPSICAPLGGAALPLRLPNRQLRRGALTLV